MLSMLLYTLQIFFLVLDLIVFLYLLRTALAFWPWGGAQIVRFIAILMTPMWVPMHYILKHSILHTVRLDLSPYILLLILTYLQELCSYCMDML